MMNKSTQAGFSLIELMIVIAIIGILATIAIPNFQHFVDKSRYSRAKSEMAGMSTNIVGERVTEENTTINILANAGYASTCTACDEGRQIGLDANLATNLSTPTVLYAFKLLGYDSVPMDPWGRPYFFDQNEGEFPATPCEHDMIYSAGMNYLVESDAAGDDLGGDDAGFEVPFYNTACDAVSTIPSGYNGY